MIKVTIIHMLGLPNYILNLKKVYDKILKSIPNVSEDLLRITLSIP